MKQSILSQFTQGINTMRFFLDEQTRRNANYNKLLLSRILLCILGIAFTIGLHGCLGPSKIALQKQFDARIGHHKDRVIAELGLPARDCTPLKFGEACQWEQLPGPPFLEGPLEGTFPGDSLTYFLNSKRIICQWRFQGAQNGTQHSESQC